MVKEMYLENSKDLIVWNGGSTRYIVLFFQIVVRFSFV